MFARPGSWVRGAGYGGKRLKFGRLAGRYPKQGSRRLGVSVRRKGTEDSMRKTFIAIALVAIVALVAGPAMAGGRGGGKGGGKPKPGTGGSGTITPAWVGDAHYNQL